MSLILGGYAGAIQAQNESLNLRDADITVLVATISEMTGKQFVLDPRVTGNVTFISSRPMNQEQIYQVFLSILRVNGFAVVESGDITRIIPEATARQDAIPLTISLENRSADEFVTQVFEITHVAAAELVNILRPLLPQSAQLTAHDGSNILIVSDRVGNILRLQQLIQRIDTASDNALELIPLEHASASELVRTLNQLIGSGPSTSDGAAEKLIADERTNTIILAGEKNTRLRMKSIIAHLDTPLASDGFTEVMYLNYASAQDLVPILESVSASLTGRNESGDENTTKANILAHKDTNSLVLTGTPTVIKSLVSVARKLDIRRAQVLIEAVIAEVSVDTTSEIGVQWQLGLDTNADGIPDSGALGGTNFGGVGTNIISAGVNPSTVGQGLNLGYIGGTVKFPGSDTDVLQLGALVRALRSDANSNILSTPSIVTLDNKQAEIRVGQEVPFLTGQFTSTGAQNGAVNPFSTISRQDIGIRLKVTPHISDDGTIVLDIEQEVSSLARTSVSAVDLITNKRTITTSVMIDDNSLLVLGGLIDEDVQETVSKVPLLGSIPLLGKLFQHRSSKVVKRNLMVFIHPRIIHDKKTADRISHGKYGKMLQIQRAASDQSKSRAQLPTLPPLSEILEDGGD